tara:strand:- start:5841 stop:6350 length:510 start_codon:yes stop_codon:yes gene_type:complete
MDMSFPQKDKTSSMLEVDKLFLVKQAMGRQAVNFFKPTRQMVRRGPAVKPLPMQGPPAPPPPQPGNNFTRKLWDYDKKRATPLGSTLSHAAGVGTLGAGGWYGGNKIYDIGHGEGQIEGAKKTMNVATDAIDNMDTQKQILFLISLIGKERPEIIEKLKELVPPQGYTA